MPDTDIQYQQRKTRGSDVACGACVLADLIPIRRPFRILMLDERILEKLASHFYEPHC